MQFKNIIEVATVFADNAKATDYLIQLRWAGRVSCPTCKGEKVGMLKGANKRFKCYSCRTQFSATKGSIFENSPVTLQKWFMAIYLITSHKKGISSLQLSKDISVTQKTAWFMLQRVRFALQSGSFNTSDNSIIEIDETFVGGKEKNKHKSKAQKDADYEARIGRRNDKTPVVGILERGGKVIAYKVPDVKGETLLPIIAEHVNPSSQIFTDEHSGYHKLTSQGYDHQTVSHGKGEYVRGQVHTNSIEGFWGLFKRGIIGIYHQVSDKHLDLYIDEFEFRYNTRKETEAQRFESMMVQCNKRLTYAQLIAK